MAQRIKKDVLFGYPPEKLSKKGLALLTFFVCNMTLFACIPCFLDFGAQGRLPPS
jgi:hypothetical protein